LEINPAVAVIGERVSIKFNVINTERNNINCGVAAFCGDSALDIREIKVGGLSSIPLLFELDTSSMATGFYSIETIVETDSGQQKLFSLGGISVDEEPLIDGGIPIEEAEPTIDQIQDIDEEPLIDENGEAESTKNTFVSTNSTSFNWEYLLPVVPAGVVSSVMIIQYKRKRSQDQAMPKEKISSMFNEILKIEQQIENGGSSEDNTNYIA
jgi:hypothetical protein